MQFHKHARESDCPQSCVPSAARKCVVKVSLYDPRGRLLLCRRASGSAPVTHARVVVDVVRAYLSQTILMKSC